VATRWHGKHDFGPQALRDLPRDYLRWFDYWLKGVENGVPKEPLVSIFVMGSNQWLNGPKYPLPQTRFEKWYLAGGGKANTSTGDSFEARRQLKTPNQSASRVTPSPRAPSGSCNLLALPR
jgi:predicted acyl esterase